MKSNSPTLINYVKVAIRWKKIILTNIFLITMIAVGISLISPKTYTANSILMPPESSGGNTLQDESNMSIFSFTGLLDNMMDELIRKDILNNIDVWLGIGGGSTMDTAKGLAILSNNPGSSINYKGFPVFTEDEYPSPDTGDKHKYPKGVKAGKPPKKPDSKESPLNTQTPGSYNTADYDQKQAQLTRETLLEKYVNQDILIIGTHFSTPTAGHIKYLEGGGYWLDINKVK